jgi:DNA-binding transcriptional MerR regulator
VSDVTDGQMTIDALARRSGMTVRNIRAHQSRGLLHPPEVRARTGYYNADHVARLELIQDLQAQGFNLEAIRRLTESAAGGQSAEVLGFTRALMAPFEDEEPEIVSPEELAQRVGIPAHDPRMARKAEKLGLLRPLADGRYELLSPRLVSAAAELAKLGVSADRYFAVAADLKRYSEGVARSFTRLFVEGVWQPFERAGRPEEDWPKILEGIEHLRPLASEALLAMFQITMTRAAEEAFGREIARSPVRR